MTPDELEQLLNLHGAALQLYARQWADSPEDCVQQAFIDLATNANVPDNPVAWLFRVVRNRAISQLRIHTRRRERETNVAQESHSLFPKNLNNEMDSEQLSLAIQSLDATVREIVVAKIWGQLSFEEIGALVDCSSSTAHRKYSVGLDELRKTLGLTWLIKK